MQRHGRVLVVDDNEVIRDLLRIALARAGCVVTTAADGFMAYMIATANPPDLFIVDYSLDFRMNGADLIRFIRGHPRLHGLPVIGFSGEDEADAEFRVAGANLTLKKPASVGEITEAVRRFIRCEPCETSEA